MVCVKGPPGIGKSRIAREAAAIADEPRRRGHCDISASRTPHRDPFHAVAGLLRGFFGVGDGSRARQATARVRRSARCGRRRSLSCSTICWASATEQSEDRDIDPDARRRRLATTARRCTAGASGACRVHHRRRTVDGRRQRVDARRVHLRRCPGPRAGVDHLSPGIPGHARRQAPGLDDLPCPLDQCRGVSADARIAGSHPSIERLLRRSPKEARETRSSPRRSCATSQSVASSRASPAHTCAEATTTSPCPRPSRPPSPPASTASARGQADAERRVGDRGAVQRGTAQHRPRRCRTSRTRRRRTH